MFTELKAQNHNDLPQRRKQVYTDSPAIVLYSSKVIKPFKPAYEA